MAHLPFATRALAVGVALTFTLGAMSAMAMHEPQEAGFPAAWQRETVDPLAHLRLRVPAATQVAGASLDRADTDAAGESIAASGDAAEATGPAAQAPPNLLPTGKGMWFHVLDDAGPVDEVVRRAQAAGLGHLYLRVGSSKMGFYGAPDMDRLLPAAHAAGLKVIGWGFPELDDPNADIAWAIEAIEYATSTGDVLDGFSADIETATEGVLLEASRVDYYAHNVRYYAGPGYPLIGTVPNACLNATFPYAEVARHFNALAPMVYWITRDPAADVACNIDRLAPLGRPVLPIGQAYDPAIDNPLLVNLIPGYDHLASFMRTAADKGAAGVSFWAWHTATEDMWRAVSDADAFTLVPMSVGHANPEQVRALQRLLNAYGYSTPVDGNFTATTVGALAQLQADLALPATGDLDDATIETLTGART